MTGTKQTASDISGMIDRQVVVELEPDLIPNRRMGRLIDVAYDLDTDEVTYIVLEMAGYLGHDVYLDKIMSCDVAIVDINRPAERRAQLIAAGK